MTSRYYTLDAQGNPVGTDDVITWAMWYESSDSRRVILSRHPDGRHISTVFLSVPSIWSMNKGCPLLWETMYFPNSGDWVDDETDRYPTGEDAIKGHWAMVERHFGSRDAEGIIHEYGGAYFPNEPEIIEEVVL